AGAERRIALSPGRYRVKKRLADDSGLLVASLGVGEDGVAVADARMDRVSLDRDPQKGFGGARWAVVAGGGGQRFFDRAARDGLFPPASLVGLELALRDDLGHGLAWGVDAALGNGAGDLRLPGVDPIPVRFSEVAVGTSLWRDFVFGRLVLSAGGRVAFTFLSRSFPEDDLPGQFFFTATPGLTGAVAWRVTPRVSAVGRVRLNYLFYNVDENRSLGFVDGFLGVEYALGD
ncbi:MAG TPA: hypothetical protein VLT61_01390, partial [Anaeromyxobacteraceae bacterium]|nr:hypothetical protein [Anaeromyxobacteraceae bacterium]